MLREFKEKGKLTFQMVERQALLYTYVNVKDSKLAESRQVMLNWCLRDILTGASDNVLLSYDRLGTKNKSPFIQDNTISDNLDTVSRPLKLNQFVEQSYFSRH